MFSFSFCQRTIGFFSGVVIMIIHNIIVLLCAKSAFYFVIIYLTLIMAFRRLYLWKTFRVDLLSVYLVISVMSDFLAVS